VSICLEDRSRAYVLLGNQIVVLLDYIRGEVLGSSRVPPVKVGRSYWNNTEISMAYDETFRRLLVIENTPDNPDGSCSMYIRGFRQVPEPVRITVPIPLKAPRQGRVVPVLVQVVGGMNEGVGGYVIEAKVEGAGSLAGLPVSDYRGNARIPVACEGSRLFVPSPADPSSDWETTGSPDATPPHTGLVVVTATARIYAPDPLISREWGIGRGERWTRRAGARWGPDRITCGHGMTKWTGSAAAVTQSVWSAEYAGGTTTSGRLPTRD
jgi:hypothetical protein